MKKLLAALLAGGLLTVSAVAQNDSPPVGTRLDTNADGTWDHTYLGNGQWDPPLTGMPPPRTLVDMNADNVADAVLVDQNGNGLTDGIDIGMDGTVDVQLPEDTSNQPSEDSPPVGTQLDTNADGVWDYVYLGNGQWNPQMTGMPPPGTLVDMDGNNVADAVLVDQNGNGLTDGIDIGMDGTVDGQLPEDTSNQPSEDGPPVGTQLDVNADGQWDHTYLGNGQWNPPLNGMPPPGTLVDMDGNNVADAVLVDQNGNGLTDGIDIGMDGTVDGQLPEDTSNQPSEDGPPVGTQLDVNADGQWDHTYLGNGQWNPPLNGMPPPGTLVDLDGNNVADAVLVDQNGNGVTDGIDMGMDGTVDGQIPES